MSPDGLDPTMTTTEERSVILPDLLALTQAALTPIEALFTAARENLRSLVSENGRVSSALIEANQTAAHGLAWLATYVEALRQMQGWADRLQMLSQRLSCRRLGVTGSGFALATGLVNGSSLIRRSRCWRKGRRACSRSC